MIYLYEHAAEVPVDLLRRALRYLPAERREKALSYRTDVGFGRCVIAYLMLLRGLRREYGIEDLPALAYGDRGKPTLVDYPGIHFSFSHCVDATICAISSRRVGVDIQSVVSVPTVLAERICTTGELEDMGRIVSPRLRHANLIRLWAIKESYIKMLGLDVFVDFREIDSGVIEREGGCTAVTSADGRYVVALCESE